MSAPPEPGPPVMRPWDIPHGRKGRIQNVVEVAALGPRLRASVKTDLEVHVRMVAEGRLGHPLERTVGPTVVWTMEELPFEECVASLRAAAAVLEVMES